MDVFLVLSGYLITSIVLQNAPTLQFLKSFYLRRGLRIWPIYYLMILLLSVAGQGKVEALPYYLTYTQQLPVYWGGVMPKWLAFEHTWTLALEEQFYLIWPVVVLLAGRRRLGYLVLAIAVIAVEARFAGFSWWLLISRCDGFALGGFLAVIMADADTARARRRAQTWALVFAVLASLMAGLLIASGHLFHGFGPMTIAARTTIASLSAYILVALLVCRRPSRVRTPALHATGLPGHDQLWHVPLSLSDREVVRQSESALGLEFGPSWAAECLLTFAVAAASWHLIERPILRLKDRIPYERKGEVPRSRQPSPVAPVSGDRRHWYSAGSRRRGFDLLHGGELGMHHGIEGTQTF